MKLQEVTNQFLTNVNDIEAWLKTDAHIRNYTINPGGVVDVNENVTLSHLTLGDGFPVQFGLIRGNFKCVEMGLTSLRGSPHTVTGEFNCSSNPLQSLEYGPTLVKSTYDCSNCSELISLRGCATEVVGPFFCTYNKKLTSLKYGPEKVGGAFNVYFCALETLEGFPKQVDATINISSNVLTTLKGMGQIKLRNTFNARDNFLTSLEYLSPNVTNHLSLDFSQNRITTLEDINNSIKHLNGVLILSHNEIASSCLGLMMITGKFRLRFSGLSRPQSALALINTHVGHTDRIFVCQEELINLGYEEYAQL